MVLPHYFKTMIASHKTSTLKFQVLSFSKIKFEGKCISKGLGWKVGKTSKILDRDKFNFK